MKGKIDSRSVVRFAGAYIAYMIGSGFATGQEIMQFYTSHGIWSIGAILVSMLLFGWVGSKLMAIGYEARNAQDGRGAYQRICGKYLGTFYEYFIPLLLFCVVVIMISGAGATINEYYGFNYYVGGLLMAALIYVAYVMGLKRLVDVIGGIGPVIIAFTIFVGIVTFAKSGASFSDLTLDVSDMGMIQAAPNWLLSGVLYAAYNLFGSVIFLCAMGETAHSRREASMGGAIGGIVLMASTLVMNIAFLSRIEEIGTLSVPTLQLADDISPVVGVLFSIVLMCGIFSTAAPMMWTVLNKIVKEGTKKSRIVALVLTLAAFGCGQLPFGQLVSIVYPFTGYLGILLFVCLVIYSVRRLKTEERMSGTAETGSQDGCEQVSEEISD